MVKDGWYICPTKNCNRKLFKLLPNAKVENIEIKCSRCDKKVTVSLDDVSNNQNTCNNIQNVV